MSRQIPEFISYKVSAFDTDKETRQIVTKDDWNNIKLLQTGNNYHDDYWKSVHEYLFGDGEETGAIVDLEAHLLDTDNPHQVTKSQVGLGNADNTSDLNKPVSTLTRLALDLKESISDANLLIKNVTFDETTGIFTFIKQDGSSISIDTLLEKIAINFRYDPDTQSIILTLRDGTTQTISLSDFITELEFYDSNTISFNVVSHQVIANIKSGSITDDMLSSAVIAQLMGYVNDASVSASNASASEANALVYKNAAQSAKTASESARDLAIAAKNSAQSDASTAVGAKNDAITAKNQAEIYARTATTIVENVYNIIISDNTLPNTKWAVVIDNGSITLLEVVNTLAESDITFIDKTTGKAYKMQVDNGILGIEEVE